MLHIVNPMNEPSRRRLLTGTAATLLSGAAAVTTVHAATPEATGDDAELIRLCAECDRLTLQEKALYQRGGANFIEDDRQRDAPLAKIYVEQQPIMERIIPTRAVTAEGIRAKTRSLVLWCEELLTPSEHLFEEQMISSILSDLLGGAAA